jgi:hypothetical protein
MKVGLLWFDDDKKRTLAEKVERAASYYQQKYSVAPSVCYVHASALEGAEINALAPAQRVNGVEVRTARTVLPNHFWIGVDEKGVKKPKSRRAA